AADFSPPCRGFLSTQSRASFVASFSDSLSFDFSKAVSSGHIHSQRCKRVCHRLFLCGFCFQLTGTLRFAGPSASGTFPKSILAAVFAFGVPLGYAKTGAPSQTRFTSLSLLHPVAKTSNPTTNQAPRRRAGTFNDDELDIAGAD